eukprot:gene18624-28720_t
MQTPLVCVRRQARKCHVKKLKIWPTDVDPFDRVSPVQVDGDVKTELHDIMRWRDPKITAARKGEESTEPKFEIPKAVDPSLLAYDDIGTMYRLSEKDMRSCFQEGFPGNLVKAFAPPMQPRCFLYRKPSHLLNKYIEKFEHWLDKDEVLRELRDNKPGFIYDGPHGCGKSALLAQSVHFARSRKMLTVYIPDASEWTSGSFVVPSTTLPGFFDSPNEQLQLLKYFCRGEANRQILSSRRLSKEYPVPSSGTGFNKLETVWDLLHYAFDDIESVPVIFKYFLDELIAIKDVPVIFIIDSYDALCKPTEYYEMHEDTLRDTPKQSFDSRVLPKSRIHASRLTLTRALNYMLMANEPNKLFITATCRQVGDRTQAEHDFAPFDPIEDTLLHTMELPAAYDDYEARTILRCYLELMEGTDADGVPLDSGWSFRRLEMSSFERMLYKIKFITNNNPYLVWQQSEMKQYWKYEFERQRQMLARKKAQKRR